MTSPITSQCSPEQSWSDLLMSITLSMHFSILGTQIASKTHFLNYQLLQSYPQNSHGFQQIENFTHRAFIQHSCQQKFYKYTPFQRESNSLLWPLVLHPAGMATSSRTMGQKNAVGLSIHKEGSVFKYLLFSSDITGLIESNYSELTTSDTPELSALSV